MLTVLLFVYLFTFTLLHLPAFNLTFSSFVFLACINLLFFCMSIYSLILLFVTAVFYYYCFVLCGCTLLFIISKLCYKFLLIFTLNLYMHIICFICYLYYFINIIMIILQDAVYNFFMLDNLLLAFLINGQTTDRHHCFQSSNISKICNWLDLPHLCVSLLISMKFNWHKKMVC